MKTLETFRDIGNYEIGSMKQDEPSCFNGMVRIRKYRVTVELVDEPQEVIEQRLQALWDSAKNSHHREALRRKAKEIGYTIK